MIDQNTAEQLTTLLVNVVTEGYSAVKKYSENTKFRFDRHTDFPRFLESESPFRNVEIRQYSNVIDYGGTLHTMSLTADVTFDDLPTFQELVEHVRLSPQLAYSLAYILRNYLGDLSDEQIAKHREDLAFLLSEPCGWLIDRYMHTHGATDTFDLDKCIEIVKTLVAFITASSLHCDFCIPILFAQFDFDRIVFGNGTRVERIPDEYQLARRHLVKSSSVLEQIFMAATHWVVFENQIINVAEPPRSIRIPWYFDDKSLYGINNIDLFMASLRVITGREAGYAQLLVRPHSWASRYKAYLPPLEGTIVRAYSSRFEQLPKIEPELPAVTADECVAIGHLYDQLLQHTKNAISVAVRRLNYCYTREHAEDIVVDATIGLEALLSNDAMEISHKIAMRMAVLATMADSTADAVNVFEVMKKVYSYRSAVVHGQKNAEKKRLIRGISGSDKTEVDAGWKAVSLLRTAIKVLIDHPALSTPEEIDKAVLRSLHGNTEG